MAANVTIMWTTLCSMPNLSMNNRRTVLICPRIWGRIKEVGDEQTIGGDSVEEETVAFPNEIAQNLLVAETSSDARYDASARNLVAERPVLAYILKSALDEYKDCSVQEIAEKFIEGVPQIRKIAIHQDHPDNQSLMVEEMMDGVDGDLMSGDDKIEGLPTVEKSQREGALYFDIRFLALIPQSSEMVEIYVNIEIQNNDKPGYPIPMRGIYHAARLISAQRGTVFKDQEYGKIKRVVSIWICEDTIEKRSDTINRYYFTEECKRGNFHEEKENYELMTVVVFRLGIKGEKSEDNAIRLLSKMFSIERTYEEKITALSDEFMISVTKEISKEVFNMCNLSTGVYNKGMKAGVAQGEMNKARDMALSLSDMGIPMEKIAEAAKVSLETVQKWLSGNVSVTK